MLDVPTKKARRFAHSRKSSRNPSWSADGSQLAFVSDREERAQVYLIPADGGEAESLTSGKNAVVSVAWSPKGDSIAFLATEPKSEAEEKKEKDKDDARVIDKDDKPVRLWVVDAASKKVRPLSTGKWRIAEFKWAPQGDRLFAIAAPHPEALVWRNRILSVSLADGATQEIASPAGPISGLQIAPDGKSLSYRGIPGRWSLASRSFPGSGRRRLAAQPHREAPRSSDRRPHMADTGPDSGGSRGWLR